ncbi:MAG: hypothetical protein A2Y12_10330 [Planctomycetes bacterium GWF2_42_9]|nr:MAG: hypothetical protein A2Y12_10330 [Planctomycetes bacterium GWF2_42_9]
MQLYFDYITRYRMTTRDILLRIGVVFLAISSVGFAGGSQIFHVDVHAKTDDGLFDSAKAIQIAIDEAIKAGPGSIVQLQKGKYRLYAEDLQPCLQIDRANDLIIQGQGKDTELIIANPRASAIFLMNSRNVFIKSLAIDYDPLPFTQGRITDVNNTAGCFDLNIDEGFPELEEAWFVAADVKYGMIFDAVKPVLKPNVPDHIFIESWEKISHRIYRLKIAASYASKVCYISKGDRFVHLARLCGRAAGVFFGNCRSSGFENVTIYASNSGAVITQASDGLIFKKYEVRLRPCTKRLLSSDADGLHCSQNRFGPLVEECLFENIGDDSLNIYCSVSRILEVSKSDELILSEHCIIKQGDRLQIYNSRQGKVIAERMVKNITEMAGQRYQVQLDGPVEGICAGADHLQADTAFNLSASGEGYVIRNNRMIGQRRHGIMVRGGKGIIENNFISGVRGLGIVLANDPCWPEGPIPRDIVIRKNTLIRVGDTLGYGHRSDSGAIQVLNTCTNYDVGKGRDIRNIVIEGNKIVDPVTTAIFVGGAKNIKILNNEIKASEGAPLYETSGAVRLANCEGVKIDGLKVVDPRPNCIAAVEILADMAADVNGIAITRLQTKLHDGAVRVLDNRK